MGTGLPLTGAQAGVWYAQQAEPTGTAFTIAAYVAITGPVELDRLRAAVITTLLAAECLHVEITAESGTPTQTVVLPATVDVPVVPVPDEAAALAWMHADRLRPMTGPYFRHSLLTGPDRVWWYQAYQHVVI